MRILNTTLALGFCFLVTACTEANFGGDNRARGPASRRVGPSAGQTDALADTGRGSDDSGYNPITDDLNEGGWVTKKAFPELGRAVDEVGGDGGQGDVPGEPGGALPGGGDDASPDNSGTSLGDVNTKDPNIPAWGEDEHGVFWVPCSAGDGSGTMQGSLRTADGATIRVSGELCPEKAVGKLNVLFVVDFSGSMEGNPFEGPNDPRTGGTCGRMRAAEALVTKFESATFNNVELSAGMVAFADNAQLRLPIADLTSLKRSLTPENWCGSISATARTNYRAAFEQARAALAGRDGKSVVYFISDGSPTVGGAGGASDVQAGLNAAQALRQAGGDNLVLNAVFLGYRNGTAQNPQSYLEQIAGSPERVRVVNGADALVQAIQTLDTVADTLSLDAVKATHAADGDSQSLAIVSLRKSSTRPGAYVYLTAPFELVGEVGRTIENIIDVKGRSGSGAKVESKAVIQFTLKN